MAAKSDNTPETTETERGKRYVVSASVPKDLFDRAEDARWGQRMKMSEFVAAALEDYLVQVEKSGAPKGDTPAK